MHEKKNTHGGRRPGAGAKPIGDAPKEPTSLRLPRDIMAYLRAGEQSAAAVIEESIRRTEAFRAWQQARSG